ncbi:MAG TPA: Rieske (2Fe-2S) protein [Acidobacteriaceae bacterium]|jgi:nitrite reductase (NADH) small subunit|nr:Rieske (2Fe-2S) protein [Acidobacteriaceae bacterium]
MSEAIRLCAKADLPAEGQAKEFPVQDKVLCVAMIGGKAMAINNVCPHRGGPLAEGTFEDGKVVCPWHQWEIDLATGAVTHSPETKTDVYPLTITGDDVVVEI